MLFTDRFKKLSINELTVSFWCVYVYSLMKDGLKTDETDYGSFFTHFIDEDIISEDYRIIKYVPKNSNMDKDESDSSDDFFEDDSLDEFFADDED